MQDMGSMTGCYVFCSLPTARQSLYYEPDETTYLLARTHEPGQVSEVLKELNAKSNRSRASRNELDSPPDIEAYSKTEFSAKSRWYWILKTKSGLAVGFTAALGLLVGAVVTSQTLYSATATLLRELAVLKALGVPRWRMNLFVVEQALVIGFVGLVMGVPLAFGFEAIGNLIGTRIDIAGWLLWGTIIIVLSMALFSGLLALRALNNVDPAELLR
jgi:putative ABC transport system permease protein